MSVHTMRQRTALQRAQQHWKRSQAHLHLVQTTPAPPNRRDRFLAFADRVHNGRWLWILAGAIFGAADLSVAAQLLGWWHP